MDFETVWKVSAAAVGLPAMGWLAWRRGGPRDPIPRAEPVVRPWGAAWGMGVLAAYFLLVIGGLGGVAVLLTAKLGRPPRPAEIPLGVLLLVDFAAKFAVVGAFFGILGWRRERPGLVRPDPDPRRSLAAGALAGLAFLPIAVGVGTLQAWIYGRLGREFQAQDIVVQAQQGPPDAFWSIAAFAILVAPPFEEFAFRGLIHSGLRSRLGPLAAALVSSALFALYHFHLDVVPAILLLGLWLAWLRDRTGGLTVPIAAHACYNAVTMAFVWIGREGG